MARETSGRRRRHVPTGADAASSPLAEHGTDLLAGTLLPVPDGSEGWDEGVIILDAEGRVVSLSPAASAVTGHTTMEVSGRAMPTLFGIGNEAETTMRQVLQRTAGVGWLKQRGTRRRKDGTEYFAGIMLTALRGGSGSLAGFMMALKDLSAERHWRDVETQAARAVVEATRMKSEFLANVSHELRTPLNAMVGYADILLDMDPTPEQRETIGRIRGATESMHNLIVNLLDSAKVERGGLEVELTPFGLRTVVQDVLAAAAPRAHQRDLELCCEIDANVPDEVSGAPSRLVQILEQLLDNAIKFTPTGEIVVRLMVDGPTRGGQLIHFSVADTGIGVPPDQRGIVFEPFVQVDGSMRRQYGGTGLGLTIARHLIQHMGGEIWIESRPEGSGTTVHFLLPLANPRPFRVPAATTLAWHVLVADDNPTARRIVGEMLERLGMIPHVAETASETESVLRSGRTGNHLVQIALVDADLRHADGTTFAASIGANPTRVPIILMTSPRHPDDVLQYRNLTAAGYLAKPLHELPLARMLGAAMKRSRRRPGRPVAARRRVGPDDLPS